MATKKRTEVASAGRPETADLALTAQELQLLAGMLQSMPISGTPDSLTQVLPLVQGVRMKVQVALRRLTAPIPEEAEEV